MAANWREWVSDRFGLAPFKSQVLDRTVPKAPWYFGDGATLVLLFGVLIVTGAVMTLTYSPTPESAYASVEYITATQTLGWFVRALHYWSAGLMVVMVFFHLFRQILVAGYKSPREGTWLIGVVLFFCVLVMGFTGYLLRWDERAVYAIKVVLHMFHRVPLVGDALVRLVQGGEEMGPMTLTRLFSVHVIWVPFLMLGLVGFHLYLVILHGVTTYWERRQPVASAEEQKKLYKEEAQQHGELFFPYTTLKSGLMATVVFAIALSLALIQGPQELQPEGNLVERASPAEEWWFWWYSGLIALLPPAIAPAFVVVFPIVVFVGLVLLPFVDRRPYRGIRKRPIAVAFVILAVLGMLYLTDLRRRSAWTGWPDPNPPPIPAGRQLTPDAEQGRQLFAQFGCNSCHAVAGHGRQVGPDLARLHPPRSRDEIRSYTLRPPEDVPMPAYEGRMTEEELNRVVEFVHVVQTFARE